MANFWKKFENVAKDVGTIAISPVLGTLNLLDDGLTGGQVKQGFQQTWDTVSGRAAMKQANNIANQQIEATRNLQRQQETRMNDELAIQLGLAQRDSASRRRGSTAAMSGTNVTQGEVGAIGAPIVQSNGSTAKTVLGL